MGRVRRVVSMNNATNNKNVTKAKSRNSWSSINCDTINENVTNAKNVTKSMSPRNYKAKENSIRETVVSSQNLNHIVQIKGGKIIKTKVLC